MVFAYRTLFPGRSRADFRPNVPERDGVSTLKAIAMARFDLVIRGGQVCGGGDTFAADVGVREGCVAALAEPNTLQNAPTLIDARGRFVVPGGVDPHVHTATKLGEFTTLDGFYESTLAAAWGGTTTIVDFAIPAMPDEDDSLAIAQKRIAMAAGQAVVDVAFHACITDPRGVDQLSELARRGLSTVKVFTIYRDLVMLPLDSIYLCMKEVASIGGILLVHAESPHIVEPMRDDFASRGMTSPYHHACSRPPEAELDMIRTILELFRMTQCMGYFVHVSVAEAAFEIARARLHGVPVWAETCPQYVFLDDSKYQGERGELYICSPPIRPRRLASELWDAVCAGAVQIWGSDHCCYDTNQKLKYAGDFRNVPNGLPGLEVRAPLLYSEGVLRNRLSLEKFVELTATNPAKLNGLYPRKGTLAIGSDADIAIYDSNAKRQLSPSALHMPTDYTPFHNMLVTGWPTTVISKGRVLIDEGTFRGERGWGSVLPSGKPEPL